MEKKANALKLVGEHGRAAIALHSVHDDRLLQTLGPVRLIPSTIDLFLGITTKGSAGSEPKRSSHLSPDPFGVRLLMHARNQELLGRIVIIDEAQDTALPVFKAAAVATKVHTEGYLVLLGDPLQCPELN